jgi:hypothetical protein
VKPSGVLLFMALVIFASGVSAQEWRTIVPLKTTRAEVEALLGHAESEYFATYKLADGNIFIEYSSGPCRPDRKGGWDVSKNIVVSVHFYPKNKRRLSELKVDRRKLRKVIDRHVVGIVYYINDVDGVVYEIQDGKVESIDYGPPKKYEHLYCGNSINSPQR